MKVEARDERLSSDAGALLLREALEHSGLLRTLMPRLTDFRDPTRTLHSLDELVRSVLLLQAQGWGDFSDVNALEADPALRVARSRDRGQAAARQALPSQATISRLLDTLARPANRAVLDAAPLQLAARRIRAANRGHRHRQLTLDIDGLPLPVHGEQPGTAYNGHVGARMHYPLIASCAETGDMLAGLLRDGNAGPAAEAAHWVPALVAEAEQHLCQRAVVRMDAGFTDGAPPWRRWTAGVSAIWAGCARIRSSSAWPSPIWCAAPAARRRSPGSGWRRPPTGRAPGPGSGGC